MRRNRRAIATLLVLGGLAAFSGGSPADTIVGFNEIQYHPATDEAHLEWIELHNRMAVDVDISGWSLDGGIVYAFAEGTIIPGGGFLVVAIDPGALAGQGIPCPVLGPFSGRLDNSGERLSLYNNSGRRMDTVRYRDSGGWPVEADGSGATLAKRSPDLASSPARSWTISSRVGGTPGDHNFPSAAGPGQYPAGLSAYWKLDEPTGTLLDSVGGNHGSAGSTVGRVAGIVGAGALSFDNTADAFVSVGTGVGGSFTATEGISVEALVRPLWSPTADDPDTIFRKEDGPSRVSLALQADGVASNRDVPLTPAEQAVISFGIQVGGTYSELDMPLDGLQGRPSVLDLKDGKAHHIVGTYDAASGVKAIWFDGERVFSHQFPAGTLMSSGGTTTAYIGNMSGRRQPFAGVIDEVAFYRRALSSEEVAQHHANALEGRTYFESAPSVDALSTVAFNEYVAPAAGPFWAEIVNHGAEPVSLEGAVLVVAGTGLDDPPEWVLPRTDLEAGGFALVSESDLGFRPASGRKLFLLSPDRRSVLAGMLVSTDHGGRLPEGTGPWLRPSRATPRAPNEFRLHDEIVIHEILYHHAPIQDGAVSSESPEAWIELFNRSGRTVDLTGWRLTDAVEYAFEPGTTLAAGEYLVVAADRDALRILHPGIRIVGNWEGRLSRSEDRLVLEDSDGNPADDVHYYDGGRWPGYPDGGGSSLELRDPRADNSKAEAWAASDEGSKAAWQDYSYQGNAAAGVGPTRWNELVVGMLDDGEALIDDLSVVESPSGTARQLLQNGGFETGATAWRFLGNHRHSEVVDDPDGAGKVLRLVATGATEHMHNHLETTFAGNAAVVNGREYRISFRAKWLAGSNRLNTRLYFNRLPRTTLLAMPPRSGTPGAPNSTREANIGPTFDGLEQDPAIPGAGEETAIRISAADPDGVAAVTLWWSAGSAGWRSVGMTSSGGGAWEGAIPGQAAASTIQFYVEARDGAGATATYPAAGRDSRALVRVHDGRSQLGRLHNFRIIMLPAEADFLHTSTNVMSNEWLPCTVVWDERTVYHDVGVRLKGSERGRDVAGRVGFHVRFHPDRLFLGVHPTIHIDRSGGWTFGGPNGHDEIIIKHIVNHAGDIPGMYDDIVRVIAPKSAHDDHALLMMAAFNDEFLDTQFEDGSEGTSHKLELIYYPTTTVDGNPQSLKLPQPDDVLGADLQNLGNDKEAYRWTLLIENNAGLDDYSGLIGLCKAMSSPAAQLDAATRAVMDVDQWMRTFTIISLCGVTDTYTQGNNHNNIFYRRPSDGMMLAFPWDMDFSWVRSTSSPLWGDQNLGRVISLPPNRRLFYQHLLDITETTFKREYMARWVDHYGTLANYDYSKITTLIDQRRAFVRSSIPARVAFAITTNGGQDFAVDAISTTLEGTGWFDIRSIIVAGREDPLDVTWTAQDRWRASVDLEFGPNDLELVAVDLQGRVLDSVRIGVTSTIGWPAPQAVAVDPIRAFPGESVTVLGTGFQPGAEALFGSTPAEETQRTSASVLLARVPDVEPGPYPLAVRNPDGRSSGAIELTVLATSVFLRGDANLDGSVDVADPVRILLHLFAGQPLQCPDAGDANDSETLDVSDAVRILSFLFRSGPAPSPPYPQAGTDPSGPGGLDCG